ncbi:hypothetical protein JCM3765_006483 [Sporobolomyces pararoseus]
MPARSRSRTQSFLGNLTTPPSSPRRPGGGGGLSISPNSAVSRANSTIIETVLHPNFDFDHHLAEELAQKEELEREDERRREHEGSYGKDRGNTYNHGEVNEEEGEEGEEEDSKQLQWKPVENSQPTSNSALPFLPYTCDSCSSISPFDAFPPICSKYRPQSSKPSSQSGNSKTFAKPLLNSDVLDRSIMFEGTGADVRRVLKRAMKSSLYGMKRDREGKEGDLKKFEDEEPFRILVLGGSVSNCRGVDQKTTCWHAGLLRWFQQNLPMEGDRDIVPDTPSLLVAEEPIGPIRLDGTKVKRSLVPPSAKDLVKRAAPKDRKKLKGRKKASSKKKTSTSRQRPSTRLINGSKSATGSSFFAYCYEEEMNLRGKNFELGKGPDLVILEYGVNDVYPHDEVATRDFEKHLRHLRSLPTKPAIIALEAASLLLASTTSFTQNAEYLHLPAAQFYDVPVLSAKQALFGSQSPFPPSASLKMQDLFLPDQHHPNEKGHEFLGDILISYLEKQACLAQSEILEASNSRLSASSPPSSSIPYVEPEFDIVKRSEEIVPPSPPRSLFTPFPSSSSTTKDGEEWILPEPRCIQVGNSKTTFEPISNSGWEKFGWARDKQYLVASKPGSTVTYEIQVGKGGTILADWLRSRFYDLGDVSVFLDGDRSKAVTLTGYWNLGWSIGVPTEIFTNVAAGLHKLTFEVLPASQSSHPSKKTSFRLIGIVST